MQWLRLYSEARIDNKLRMLTDAQHRIWFNLLCYAGEQPQRGEIADVDEYGLAVECADGNTVLLQETLRVLERLRIVRVTSRDTCDMGVTVCDGSDITFVAWDERQYDKPSDRPEETAERKRRSREKARRDTQSSGKAPSLKEESREVTPCHAPEQSRADTEQSRADSERGADAPPKPKRAASIGDWQPTNDEREWALGEGFTDAEVNAQLLLFRDYYRGNGKPMKDWPATFRNWMRRSRTFGAPAAARASPPQNGRATAQDFLDLMHEDANAPPGHTETVIDAAYSVSNGQALGAGGQRHRQGVEHDPGRR